MSCIEKAYEHPRGAQPLVAPKIRPFRLAVVLLVTLVLAGQFPTMAFADIVEGAGDAPAEQGSDVAVAKVDYREIEFLLTSVVLSKSENRALRERYEAKKQAAAEAQERMQEALASGKFNPSEHSGGFSFLLRDEDVKRVKQLSEKQLLLVVERIFDDNYDLILKEEHSSSVIYSRIPVDDVTNLLKQELLRLLPVDTSE
ncbi:MAG: hypothetical protein ACFB21_13215 [Opitutales bacterium]